MKITDKKKTMKLRQMAMISLIIGAGSMVLSFVATWGAINCLLTFYSGRWSSRSITDHQQYAQGAAHSSDTPAQLEHSICRRCSEDAELLRSSWSIVVSVLLLTFALSAILSYISVRTREYAKALENAELSAEFDNRRS